MHLVALAQEIVRRQRQHAQRPAEQIGICHAAPARRPGGSPPRRASALVTFALLAALAPVTTEVKAIGAAQSTRRELQAAVRGSVGPEAAMARSCFAERCWRPGGRAPHPHTSREARSPRGRE
jgi:hypothetical protein